MVNLSVWQKIAKKKNESKNQKSGCVVLLGMFQGFQNYVYFFLARTVIDFYSFEFYGKSTKKTINCQFSQKPWPKSKKVQEQNSIFFSILHMDTKFQQNRSINKKKVSKVGRSP